MKFLLWLRSYFPIHRKSPQKFDKKFFLCTIKCYKFYIIIVIIMDTNLEKHLELDSQKDLLWEFKENVYENLDVEKSINHLYKLVYGNLRDRRSKWYGGAKSYEDLMTKEDSRTTILAIQNLLKDRWYYSWNLDWFLKTKWSTTSKTMKAIENFQKEKWITPVDWIPWIITLKELLRTYGYKPIISEEEFKDFQQKTLLSNTEIDWIIDYEKVYINLDRLRSITDKQAESLWKVEDLWFNWLRSITDKQAESLWKVKRLWLNWLRSITDKQAESLWKVEYLWLNWLTNITDKQAESLWKVRVLWLNWLRSITDKQAESLWKVEDLWLDWLESITDKQIEILSKSKARFLNLWLRSITDKQVEILSKKRGCINLDRLTSITDKQAESLSKVETLSLWWLKSITDKQAVELAKVPDLFMRRDILTPKQRKILEKQNLRVKWSTKRSIVEQDWYKKYEKEIRK